MKWFDLKKDSAPLHQLLLIYHIEEGITVGYRFLFLEGLDEECPDCLEGKCPDEYGWVYCEPVVPPCDSLYCWNGANYTAGDDEVSHWMPLPAPPNEEPLK